MRRGTRPLIVVTMLVCCSTAGAACGAAVPPSEETTSEPEVNEESAEASEDAANEGLNDICDGEQISAAEVYELISGDATGITVIDIRRPAEYEEGHVPGSLYIGIMQDDFLQRLREFPRDDTYIIICWHGNTSRSVVFNMMREGFSSVCDIAGGYDAWRAAGLPLEQGAP